MPRFSPQDTDLRRFIEAYWVLDARHGLVLSPEPVHTFPSLAAEFVLGLRGTLVLHYHGRRIKVNESVAFGYIDGGLTVDARGVERAIVVTLQARGLAALAPFAAVPLPAFADETIVAAHDLFGEALAPLERHLDACPPDRIAPVLDAWLRSRLDARRAGVVAEVAPLLRPDTTVADLTRLTGLSYSTLARHFRAACGLPPKRYLRRHRFRHVLDALPSRADLPPDWLDFVARFGYHDQSHLIRDVRHFTGLTPTALHALATAPVVGEAAHGEHAPVTKIYKA
ncbi:MAG: helix-turn-helix domain-containing protein [Bacteroidota bacterium]